MQDLVEQALDPLERRRLHRRRQRAAREANLRWAANTLTTNGRWTSRLGHRHLVSVDGAAGPSGRRGYPQSVTSAAEVADLVTASRAAARAAGPADDAAPLVTAV